MKRILSLCCSMFVYGGFASAQDVFTYLADFKEVAFYGFADSAGNTKTAGKYNLIMRPSEGISRVWAGQKSSSDYAGVRYGYCLPNGTELIIPKFNKAEDFSEGMAVVAIGDTYKGYQYGYVNAKGQVQVTPQYKDASHFRRDWLLYPPATSSGSTLIRPAR